MGWSDWVEFNPKTKAEIISKIENDGYTYPHYDKQRNRVKFVMCLEAIKKDCQNAGVNFGDVYPLQIVLF